MTETRGSTATERGRTRKEARPSLPSRIALFYRQVLTELRKVVWPTRNELVTYTSVVVVFVAVIIAIVSVMDYGFGKAVLAVFG